MSAFSPAQMFQLDQACWPLREAFNHPPYLVGTAAKRETYRDVDVRQILTDDEYDRLSVKEWTALALMICGYMQAVTGLPIDFQFQRMTQANELHDGPRNPLGGRTLRNFLGDAHGDGGES